MYWHLPLFHVHVPKKNIMPDDFVPCVCLYDVGREASPVVSFSVAGDGIVRATASFIPADFIHDYVELVESDEAAQSLMPFSISKY